MGYEAHLNISLNVFVRTFFYVPVVKWALKNKNIFIFVK